MTPVERKLSQSGNFHPDYALFVERTRASNHAAGSRFKIDNMEKLVKELETIYKASTPEQKQILVKFTAAIVNHFGFLANPIKKHLDNWKKELGVKK
jgi:DNA mismatch repair ATPase MutS